MNNYMSHLVLFVTSTRSGMLADLVRAKLFFTLDPSYKHCLPNYIINTPKGCTMGDRWGEVESLVISAVLY